MSNTNRAVSRVRRSLGKKRGFSQSMQVQALKGSSVKRPVYADERMIDAVRETSTGGIDNGALERNPNMVTDASGVWRFRPVSPVPVRRGRL